jgi:hypothetical protein
MALLTIVLVTQPSRSHYFALCVESITEALESFGEIDLLVIFNGRNTQSEAIVENLASRFLDRISSHVFQENSPMPARIWEIVRSRNPQWVHFPGDDDLVTPEHYKHFIGDAQRHRYGAYAFEAEGIDSLGHKTGRQLKPFLRSSAGSLENLVGALHQPPFVWPALIFDVSQVPFEVLESRLVFDWWVSLQIIRSKPFKVIKEPLIMYREHETQESKLVSNRRKRFEAMLMIERLMDDGLLQPSRLTDEEAIVMERTLTKKPPIYGDDNFSAFILLKILRVFKNLVPPDGSGPELPFMRWARAQGVLISNVELLPLMNFGETSRLRPTFNFSLEIHRSCCPTVRRLFDEVFLNDDVSLGFIVCNHSDTRRVKGPFVPINCNDLTIEDNMTSQMELISSWINQFSTRSLESSDLSPTERSLVQFFRLCKSRVRKFRSLFRYR